MEELIGSPDMIGSNLWKVNDLVDGYEHGRYKKGDTNHLALAPANGPELALLPPDQADAIRNRIAITNRTALDSIYDARGVDYTHVTIWERILPNMEVERQTVYPFGNGKYCFVELAYTHQTNSERISGAPHWVTVMIGQPEPESGYIKTLG